MKNIAKIELSQDGEKYFAVINIAGNPKEYVTANARTPRIALSQAAQIIERNTKE